MSPYILCFFPMRIIFLSIIFLMHVNEVQAQYNRTLRYEDHYQGMGISPIGSVRNVLFFLSGICIFCHFVRKARVRGIQNNRTPHETPRGEDKEDSLTEALRRSGGGPCVETPQGETPQGEDEPDVTESLRMGGLPFKKVTPYEDLKRDISEHYGRRGSSGEDPSKNYDDSVTFFGKISRRNEGLYYYQENREVSSQK